MDIYNRLSATIGIALCAFTASYAQNTKTSGADTLRRELTIVTDRPINIPIERPLPLRILFKDPILSPLRLPYAEYSSMPNIKTMFIGARDISPLAEVGFLSPKRGYAHLGFGSLFNTRADIGYLILMNQRSRLSFDAHHRSTFEWLAEESAEARTKGERSHTGVAFDFSHLFDAFALDVRSAYGHRYHNYYGILDRPEMVDPTPKDYTSMDKLHMHSFDVGLGVKSLTYVDAKFLYDARLDFGYTTRRVQISNREREVKEWRPTFDLLLQSYTNQNFAFGLMAQAGFVNTYTPIDYPLYSVLGGERTAKTNFFVQGAPFISLSGGNGSVDYRLKAGLGIMFNYGNASKLAFYPLVDAALSFAETCRFYLSAQGGLRMNDLRAVYEENPFVDPRYMIDPSRKLVDARLGFAAGIMPGLSLDVYAGSKYTSHDYFLALTHLDGAASDFFEDSYRFQLGFAPYYSNSFVWSAGIDLTYDYRGLFGFKLGGRYDKWKLYNAAIAAGKPSLTAYAMLETNPIDRLKLSLQYHLRAGIEYPDYFSAPDGSVVGYKLKDAQLLDLRADYKMSQTFSAYVAGSNLLFQRYSDLYGYPARGASVMIGCNINL